MARSKTVIDVPTLQGIIDKLEQGTKYQNRGTLFEAAAVQYIEATGKKISATMISTRFEELGLTCLTPKSNRGRPRLQMSPEGGKAAPRATPSYKMTKVEIAGPEADLDQDPDPVETN